MATTTLERTNVDWLEDEPCVVREAYAALRQPSSTPTGLRKHLSRITVALKNCSRGQKGDFIDAIRDLRIAIDARMC